MIGPVSSQMLLLLIPLALLVQVPVLLALP